MALWLLQIHSGQDLVTLRYFEKDAEPKDCGRGRLALLPELLGFVIDQSSPWDLVRVGKTVLVRQVAPFVRA